MGALIRKDEWTCGVCSQSHLKERTYLPGRTPRGTSTLSRRICQFKFNNDQCNSIMLRLAMEDKDITFSMTSGIGHFVCCNFGAKQVYLSISQIAVPLYLAKVVVGRPHPFVGLCHFRPLAARWERLQWGSMCLHGPPSCEKRFLLQLHVCFWSQFIFLWHLLTFPDLCRVLIQVLLVKNLRGILWKHFSVRARLPNLLSGHNLRIRYVKEMDCSANGVLRKVQRGSCWS